jgi:hypothetical protein
MAAGTASVDTMLADAIAKMDALHKRMDALEVGEKHIIKGDDDDDDDRKDSAKRDSKKADDDDDDRKDSARKDSKKKADDDDDRKDDGMTTVKAKTLTDDDDDKKDDDGELEIKHGEKKDSKRKDSARKDAKKADDDDDDRKDSAKKDSKKDSKKADDDDDDKRKDSAKRGDDDDDKKDDSRADAVTDLRRQIADQAKMIRRMEALLKPRSDDEHAAFADAQAKADSVFTGFGQRAPRPLEGEDLGDYRRRLASKLKSYSTAWKSVKLTGLPDEAFNIAENQIYSDAASAAANPTDLAAGEMREVQKVDPATGLRTIVFYGTESFVKKMGRPGRRVASFRTLASQ